MALRRAADSDDVWEGEMVPVVVEGRRLLLVRLDGKLRAYDDRCAHQGVALSEGKLADGILVCRAHLYEYDARSGAGVNPRTVALRAYPVEEHDGAIFVEVAP